MEVSITLKEKIHYMKVSKKDGFCWVFPSPPTPTILLTHVCVQQQQQHQIQSMKHSISTSKYITQYTRHTIPNTKCWVSSSPSTPLYGHFFGKKRVTVFGGKVVFDVAPYDWIVWRSLSYSQCS